MCNDIFTSLTLKKVHSPAKQFQDLFSLCPNHFRWNGTHFRSLTMFFFNFGVGSLKQSVKLGWFIIFDFLGNSPLKTPLFPNWQPKSSASYSVFVVWAVFQLQLWKKTNRNVGHCFACKFSNFVATSKACIWLAVYEFLWSLTNQNVWFVTFFALN